MKFLIIQIAAIILVSTTLLRAQAERPPPPPPRGEPTELSELRKQFAVRGLEKAHTLSDQYSNALVNLEHELAATGDYVAAQSARRRRLEIAAAYKDAFGQNGGANSILLKPADAKVSGSVLYERTADMLSGWRKAGSSATWDVLKIKPGTYQISLTYLANGNSSGEYDFFEDSTLPGAELNHRTSDVKFTQGKYETTQLPPITLQYTNARFTLHITKVRGTDMLMSLKEVRLIPVVAATPETSGVPNDAAAPGADEFTALQLAHAAKITALAQPLSDAYLTKLSSIEASLDKQEDPEMLAAINAERARVQRWLANPTASNAATRIGNVSATLSTEGFTVLADDARFVPDATNAGDTFRVSHGAETIALRLLWVTCPPSEPDDKAALAHHAEYFGIAPEDAESVGKQAQEFTASVLADKPLRILTRGAKDNTGRILAVVIPEGMDDLASILVENGLAAINPPPGKKNQPRRVIFSPLQALKDREAAVKKRPITPGAWGLAVK